MSLLEDLKKLLNKEKTKIVIKENQDEVLKKKQEEEMNKKKKEIQDDAIYKKFRENYEYGKIRSNIQDSNFKNAGMLTFSDCLQKAYCKNLTDKDRENGICSNDENFYPYMTWKQLETQNKGLCWLGNKENDIKTFINDGDMSVYITPIEGEGTINLDKRENQGKIEFIKRLQQDLDMSTRNLLHAKNKYDERKDETIKDNYMMLSGLDNTIATLSQKIRQNNGKFLINEKATYILDIGMKVAAVILTIFLIYFSIKYARNAYNMVGSS